MPLLGYRLGHFLNAQILQEVVQATPALICSIFVLRLPKRPAPEKKWTILRTLFLFAPFPFAISNAFDKSFVSYPGTHMLLWATIDALAIGAGEEITFRFSLHRLWARYGNTFYVAGSSLIFGLMHFDSGVFAVVLASIIGVTFAIARIAGMPIIILILLHAVVDFPRRLPSDHFQPESNEAFAIIVATILAVGIHIVQVRRGSRGAMGEVQR